jgi:putative PIN family toxin of toxin-antitoxin system
MRALLDTNILARSTPGKGGPARQLLDLVAVSPHVLVLSPFLLTELSRVLRYDRMRAAHGLDEAQMDAYVQQLQTVAMLVNPFPVASAGIVQHDPDDDPVIAAAIDGQVEVICTRDRHLRHPYVQAHCATHGIRVLNDTELLKELGALLPPQSGTP